MTTTVETTSLGEQIQNALKGDILSGRMAPGQRIAIEELAARWGVSSTPVRDAIRRLESVGFVTVQPRRGIYVAELDADAFRDIFELRIALECLAVETATLLAPEYELDHVLARYREAAEHLRSTGDRSLIAERDYMMHDLLMRFCRNLRLVAIMDDLRDLIDWAQATIVGRQPEAYDVTVYEHIGIVEAMRARDVATARQAVRVHLERALARYQSNPRRLVHDSARAEGSGGLEYEHGNPPPDTLPLDSISKPS
jgi:DNA-binding GntR family transcriptional regulator